ncbi:protelomerase family protein [Nocardia paucivorans]|uniref:protelomerase family protein n=1 Tax=Nocardia paucivorans TaxID=114259 RepID=UPI0009FDD992|nr:protelomerase family protein [Nocardia paucivorans]
MAAERKYGPISQAEEDRITAFVERMSGMSPDKWRMAALSELSWIHNRRKANGEKYSELTNRKLIIAYRNAIIEKFGERSKLLDYLRYSDARIDEYHAHQEAARETRHRNVRPLDADHYVTSAMLLLGNCLRLRWSTNAAIAALCALSGRRPVEIALTGKFTPTPGTRHEVVFSGQAKTKDDERAEAPYVIPILGDRALFLEGIERLRAEIDMTMDPKKFNSRHAKEIGIQSKRVFKDLDGKPIMPSDLREAYAAVSFYEFAPKQVTEIRYKGDVLGHKTLDPTLDYLGFNVQE